MAEKKFIIEVRTKGFSKATRDFDKLKNSGSNFNKTQDRMRGSSDGFRGSIGALRNQILVYTFAIGGAVGAMNKFISASQGFQDVKTRLVGLTGSVEAAEQAFQTFNQIASTTPFALQDVVNAGAQLEAFGVDSEATLSAVTDLAAYMGTTATEAANSLGRAFAGGAGAADILRDKGILQLIKDSQGIEDLSKTTLPEFRRALLNSLVDPAARIAGSADRMSKTYTGAVSNMRDAMTQFSAQLGDVILPKLTELVIAIENTFREANIQRVIQFGTAVSTVSAFFVVWNKRLAITAALTFQWMTVLKALGAVLAIFVGDRILQATNAFSSLNTQTKQNVKFVQSAQQKMRTYMQTLQQTTIVLGLQADVQQRINTMMSEAAILTLKNNGVDEKRIAIAQMLLETRNNLSDSLKDVVEIDKLAAVQGKINFQVSAEATDAQREEANVLLRLIQEKAKNIQMMDEVKTKNQEITLTSQQTASAILGIAGALKTMTDAGATAEQRFSTLLSTIGGILMMIPGQQIPGALLQAGSMFIGHTGGLIKDNGIQRFAQGGMVQGRDNVPILAQSGEFIMQRSAVQNIGVDQLAQMNSTGQSNGVTINIQGNMIGNESFVRDTLIPEISKAQNQGLA